jgi:DNA-binding FadR family transcriptional regulator
MMLDPINPPLLLAAVRQWLTEVQATPNRRLPPERKLAEKFAVSRAELRKVLAALEREGLIQRHVGRGTFVTQPGETQAAEAEEVAAMTNPVDAMQARSMVEPDIARIAAMRASSKQIAEMRRLCMEMREAKTWDVYAELDWRFHNLLAEATGNVVLVEIQRLVNGVRRYVVWGNLIKRPIGPAKDYHSFMEHEQIVEAIASRDRDAAHRAMLNHLGGTRAHMIDQAAG